MELSLYNVFLSPLTSPTLSLNFSDAQGFEIVGY
jgi:hypothetical protein